MGHVLFHQELNGNSLRPLVWPCVNSKLAHFVLIQPDDFAEMWKDSLNRDLEVSLSQIGASKHNPFLRNLSKQTFQRLICEKSHLRKFKRGQLILPIHPRSPWNYTLFKKN